MFEKNLLNPIMPLEEIGTMLFFKGCCESKDDLPKNPSIGDVYYAKDSTYVYSGEKFEKIGDLTDAQKPQKITSRVCSQCGAPVNDLRTHCEYCGVKYV